MEVSARAAAVAAEEAAKSLTQAFLYASKAAQGDREGNRESCQPGGSGSCLENAGARPSSAQSGAAACFGYDSHFSSTHRCCHKQNRALR